jgi:predicted ATPase
VGPTIYISHVMQDLAAAREIYDELERAGFRPWLASKDVVPGENWKELSLRQLSNAAVAVFLVSKTSIQQYRIGEFFWKEIEAAFHQRPQNALPSIPVRLEPCNHESIVEFHGVMSVDWFEPDGTDRLLKALRHHTAVRIPDSLEIPTDLVHACVSGNCVLYVGAGLSASAGLPVWRQFVERLLEWAERMGAIDATFAASLREAADGGMRDLAVDSVVGRVTEHGQHRELHQFLEITFLSPSVELTAWHKAIHELPFSAVLTTNFDRLLERTFEHLTSRVLTPRDTEELLAALTRNQFFLLKLYGTLERPDTVLVSPAQYESEIEGNRAFAQFMESLFVTRTLLFLGASLEGIMAYLEAIPFQGGKRRHYAVVAVNGSGWRAKADQLMRRYGIQVLPYAPSADHAALRDFLTELASRIQELEPARKLLASVTRKPFASLKSVRLQNIGPFGDLQLELDPHWNVLLGDNGVGKSTVLKAIALAVCGRAAQGYADRLIQVGKRSAEIALETTDGKRYVTKLFRTSDRTEVESLPTRPLESEGWLVVGFPPVRSVTWRPVSGPQLDEGKRRPTAEDVLPLVAGEPDPRMDELKQWIISLDYWIEKAGAGNGRPKDYYIDLRNELFRIMSNLTSTVHVQFERIDPESRRVLVRTDDGLLPLEAVSQGTASLIGWVGFLLQRLYAVFPDSSRPCREPAIVLVDEIDAHMHPEWQQGLVQRLSEEFPNIQFIVTTHSPLVVAGMPVEQVVRFDRNTAGEVVRLEIPPDMMMGRADQILTGRLFGLRTTLDPLTEQAIDRFRQLSGRSNLSSEEAEELDRLRRTLDLRIPVPQETPAERRAQEYVQALIEHQLGAAAPEVKQFVLEKAKRLLDEVQHQDDTNDPHRLGKRASETGNRLAEVEGGGGSRNGDDS